MKDLVSVIIPIYNSEKYLKECIASILKQSYENIEVILIDNDSKDKSQEIALSFKKEDSRIIVISKKNEGTSNARNKGIDISNGKYIMFVDPDDILEENAIENLVNKDGEKIDLIVGNYTLLEYNKKEEIIETEIQDIDFLNKKLLNKNYKSDKYLGNLRTVWSKLYKSDIIKKNNVRFLEDIVLFEDGFFNLKYFSFIKNVKFINESVYKYRVNNNTSVLHKFYDNLYEQACLKIDYLEKSYGDKEEYREILNLFYFELFLDYVKNNFKRRDYNLKNDLKVNNLIFDKYIKNINTKYLTTNQKIIYILYKYKMYKMIEILNKLKR